MTTVLPAVMPSCLVDEESERAWLVYAQRLLAHSAHVGRQRLLPAQSFAQLPRRDGRNAYRVGGLLPRDGIAILGGVPKSRKSWFALDLVIAVASGQAVLGGRPVQPGPVLYVALEDQKEDVRTRLRALGAGRGITEEELGALDLWVVGGTQLDLLDLQKVEEIVARGVMALHQKHPDQVPSRFALIVIDPLRDAHSANEDSSTEMRPVLASLRGLQRALGGTVLVTHHLSKGSSRQGGTIWDRLRGSGAILGAVDAALMVDDPDSPDPGKLTATLHTLMRAGRGTAPCAVTLTIDDDAGEAIFARWSEAALPTRSDGVANDAERIAIHLQAHPDGLAMSRLREVIGGNDHRVKAAVSALTVAGRVTTTQRGKATVVRLALPLG